MGQRKEINIKCIADSPFVGVHRRILVFNEVQGEDQNQREVANTVRRAAC